MLFTPEMAGLLDRDRKRAAAHILPEAENPQVDAVARAASDAAIWVSYGLPVARVTFSWHRHEQVASLYWGLELRKICKATGAERALFYPADLGITAAEEAVNTRHMSGTLRTTSPTASLTAALRRMVELRTVTCEAST